MARRRRACQEHKPLLIINLRTVGPSGSRRAAVLAGFRAEVQFSGPRWVATATIPISITPPPAQPIDENVAGGPRHGWDRRVVLTAAEGRPSVILSAAKDLAWEWLEPIRTRSLAALGMTTHERAYRAYLSNPFAIVCSCMLLVPS